MAIRYSSPTLFDDARKINISKLKAWGYLAPQQVKSGRLNWSIKGDHLGSISITADTSGRCPTMELDYKYRDEPRKYKVCIVSVPSNLGTGVVWYFLCPQTNKRCRILYSIGGYFLHREAFKGAMYDTQVQSKKHRLWDAVFGNGIIAEKLYTQLYKKHFKKTYAGKATKKYLKLRAQILQVECKSNRSLKGLLNGDIVI